MSWTYYPSCKSREALMEKIISPREYSTEKVAVIGHADKGDHVWVVKERTFKAMGDKLRSIVVHFIDNQGGEWGHKDISECESPYAFDCPMEFLTLVPMPDDIDAMDWRLAVRRHHARLASIESLQIGDQVCFDGTDNPMVKLTSITPLLGIADDGKEYIVDPTMLKTSGMTGRVVTL